MKLAFITPTTYLQKFSAQGDIYLALAHLIDDNGTNEYARFHRREAEKGRRVILDNGLFEGAQVGTEELLRRATAIKASVVCAPDVLYDSKGTIKAFKQFIRAKQEYGLVAEVMGIPQADNQADWWECFQFMDMHGECDLIGLSILSVPKSFAKFTTREQPITSSRVHLIRQLYSYSDLSGHRITPCHLLGLGESYDDILEARRLLSRDIVSNDSSSVFVHGVAGVRYEETGLIPGGKIHQKLNFNFKPASFKTLEDARNGLIQYNIDIAKSLAHGAITSRISVSRG